MSACSNLTVGGCQFLQIGRAFAVLNPHLNIQVQAPQGQASLTPTDVNWRKWSPSSPTSAHWYTAKDLGELIAGYLVKDQGTGRERTVREFVAEFAGLSSSAKQKAILDSLGLSRVPLSSLASDGELDLDAIQRLLEAMQRESKPVNPKSLGVIGEDHLRMRLTELNAEMETFQYRQKSGTENGLPYVVEAAFACAEDFGDAEANRRLLISGVNWSPSIAGAPFDSLGGDWTFDSLVQDQRCGSDEPIMLVVHLAIPKVAWENRGKSSVCLDGDVAKALIESVVSVTKHWCKARKAEEREANRRWRRRESLTKSDRRTFKTAAESVIPEAYRVASADGTLPANARQIMYPARPALQEQTGRELGDQYFTQTLLPDFITEHPELTKDWDVVYDARGHLWEPHTGREVPLGTLAVREYLSDMLSFVPGWVDSITLPSIDPNGCRTCGPMHRFGAILFIEKEGFMPLFRAVQLAERYDLAIMSTKGVSVTAARKLLDDLAGYAREHLSRRLPLLVLHDFDKAGFTILGTFKRASRRYEYEHDLNVTDLGLRLVDVEAMNLQTEAVFVKGDDPRRNLRQNGATDEEIAFLLSGQRDQKGIRGQRVELNAMTSGQFVAWLERKLAEAGVEKVIPPEGHLGAAYRQLRAERDLQRIMCAAKDGIVEAVNMAPLPRRLEEKIRLILNDEPHLPWDAALARIVKEEAR